MLREYFDSEEEDCMDMPGVDANANQFAFGGGFGMNQDQPAQFSF